MEIMGGCVWAAVQPRCRNANSSCSAFAWLPLAILAMAATIVPAAFEGHQHAVVSGIFGPVDSEKYKQYVTEAMALGGSLLRHHVKADRVLLVSETLWAVMSHTERGRLQKLWSIEFTELLRCEVNEVALYSIFPASIADRLRQKNPLTCTKLQAFGLVKYRKILWMDSDTLALTNIDFLFQWPAAFAAAPDPCTQYMLNTGVVLLEPNLTAFEGLKEIALGQGSFDGGDQGVANVYFGAEWHTAFVGDGGAITRLPQSLNAPPGLGETWDGLGRVMSGLLEPRGLAAGVLTENKVIHFMGLDEKPAAVMGPVLDLMATDSKAAYKLLRKTASNSEVYEQWTESLLTAMKFEPQSVGTPSSSGHGEL